MEALNMIGILVCEVEEDAADDDGKVKRKWIYNLAEGFDHDTLLRIGW